MKLGFEKWLLSAFPLLVGCDGESDLNLRTILVDARSAFLEYSLEISGGAVGGWVLLELKSFCTTAEITEHQTGKVGLTQGKLAKIKLPRNVGKQRFSIVFANKNGKRVVRDFVLDSGELQHNDFIVERLSFFWAGKPLDCIRVFHKGDPFVVPRLRARWVPGNSVSVVISELGYFQNIYSWGWLLSLSPGVEACPKGGTIQLDLSLIDAKSNIDTTNRAYFTLTRGE